ncbi:MAG: AbrB/MazE/SpoVT family DNA-binding domain-containing protein [bacterium]|nr:AbrB/MazE/SpoVT family DNA-binding domain-containing protein [bacterium]
MAKTKENDCCNDDNTGIAMKACCKIEAVASVDERGQLVLPKDLREKAGLKAGDKLAIMLMEKEGKSCCFFMIKADELSGMVKDFLGPVMKDML